MDKINNFADLGYSDGVKSCFQTINYKGVYIHTCMVGSVPEVTVMITIEGHKYGYKGGSLDYAKRKIREFKSQFTAFKWYTELNSH